MREISPGWGLYSLFRVSGRSEMRRDCLTHARRNYVDNWERITDRGRRLRFGACSNFLGGRGATFFCCHSIDIVRQSHTPAHTHIPTLLLIPNNCVCLPLRPQTPLAWEILRRQTSRTQKRTVPSFGQSKNSKLPSHGDRRKKWRKETSVGKKRRAECRRRKAAWINDWAKNNNKKKGESGWKRKRAFCALKKYFTWSISC